MKKILLLATLATTLFGFSQEKPIMIVANNLAELGTFDKYYLHTYTKQFFEKDGFVVYYENELPLDLVSNRCAATVVNFKDKSNMFATKLLMELKDCTGKVIFTSDEGFSREKSYQTAYRQAFFEAAKSYSAKKGTIDFTAPVLDQVVHNSKANIETKVITEVQKSANTVVAAKQSREGVKTLDDLKFVFKDNALEGVLLDANNVELYKIVKTSIDNLYTASNKYVDGIIYKKENNWYFEYTKNGEKLIELIK